MRISRRRIFAGTSALFIALLAWSILGSDLPIEESLPESKAPVPSTMVSPSSAVEVVLARKGELIRRISASGRIHPRRELQIMTRVPGTIDSVAVCTGERVRKGDLLVSLDKREYQTSFDHARLMLLGAQIEFGTMNNSPFIGVQDSLERARRLTVAERAYAARADLYRRGLLSDDGFARAQREYDVESACARADRADVVAFRSGLSMARDNFERAAAALAACDIRAPFGGTIADCSAAAGAQAYPGAPLLRLIEEEGLSVDVEIPETEIARIATGMKAHVRLLADADATLAGEVSAVNPRVDPASGAAHVSVSLSASALRESRVRVLAGMYATASIQTEVFGDCLVIPRRAVLMRDERSVVFTLSQGRACWHYVRLGREGEQAVEILSGLSEGDSVIIDGQYNLVHGAAVLRRDSSGADG